MGHLEQGAGDGGVSLGLDGLAILEELVPGIVGAGDGHAAVGQDLGVDKHVLPEAGGGNGVGLAVLSHGHHGIPHVVGVAGIGHPDGGEVHHLARLDEGLGVGVGEEEEDVRLGAGLEVGKYLGLPLLVGGGRGIQDGVSDGGLIGGTAFS